MKPLSEAEVRRYHELGYLVPGSSVFARGLDPVQGRSGVPVAFATRPPWLLRGRDRAGRNDFSVGFEGGA